VYPRRVIRNQVDMVQSYIAGTQPLHVRVTVDQNDLVARKPTVRPMRVLRDQVNIWFWFDSFYVRVSTITAI